MSFYWRPYVPVAQRRAKALEKMKKLRKKGKAIQPVEIEGKAIARSFWGKAWCDHLESFSDFSNRLPRGRTYVRNGSVCHLEIGAGRIEAIVSGSELYNISIDIKPLKPAIWKSIKKLCVGRIGSMLELLQGRLSDHVMSIVTDRKKGLMPLPGEIKLKCSCPDWAEMCKHVAAVLYGIGSRLDSLPDMLFTLRGVDANELISADIALPASDAALTGKTIAEDKLSDIFGIDMDITSGKRNNLRRTVATIGKTKPPSDLPTIQPTGKSVKKMRKQLGFSVYQFAKRLAVSSAIVYRLEKTSGRLNLQSRILRALAALHQQIASK